MYPKPVSESIEQTGPGEMVFLSYPKYYQNAEGTLTEVNTTLVPSKDKEWDYEVTTGIWALRVRKDGAFQAQHKGDIFTYRLNSIGAGRGSTYHPFVQGEPNFKNYQVLGDTIRWNEVFPQIDLSVRYINDILKVDVIVKSERKKEISALVQKGELDGEDYLTARFDIPQVFFRSQPMQDNEKVNVYAKDIDFDRNPLTFVLDGKEVHQVRLAESYIIDPEGKRIWNNAGPDDAAATGIRSSQVWRLNEGQPGIAEISANLGDILKSPEGDLVIDPSSDFKDNNNTFDATLSGVSPNTRYGNSNQIDVGTATGDLRTVIAFRIDPIFQTKYPIKSAILDVTMAYFPYSSETIQTRAYQISRDWSENLVTWNSPWTSVGGDYVNSVSSSVVNISNSYINPIRYDVTKIIQAHATQEIKDVSKKGILIKKENSPTIYCSFYSSEATSNRPSLTVYYNTPQFGGHTSDAWNYINNEKGLWSERISYLNNDNLKIHRYYFSDDVNVVMNEATAEYAAGSKLLYNIHVFDIVNAVTYDNLIPHNIINFSQNKSTSQYASWVTSYLNNLSTYVDNGTIVGIEIGNEEDTWGTYKDYRGVVTRHPLWKVPDLPSGGEVDQDTLTPAGWQKAGENLAPYIAAAQTAIKSMYPNLPVFAPAISYHQELDRVENGQYSGTNAFLRGMIAKIMSDNGGSQSKLPDVISIHGYTLKGRPEGWSSDTIKYWYDHLDSLQSICSAYNYYPQFSQTEYGFANSSSSAFGCNIADETSQAIYYLRRFIMDGVMRSHPASDKAKFWSHSLIYTHLWGETGWMKFSNPNYENKKIASVADILLFSGVNNLGLNSNHTPWLDIKSNSLTIKEIPRNYPYEVNVNYIQCGWVTENGQKWGAIWKYDTSTSDVANQFIDFNELLTTSNLDFTIDNDSAPQSVIAYRFNFSGAVSLTTNNTSISKQPNGTNKYKYTIPGVDENPTFLKFSTD